MGNQVKICAKCGTGLVGRNAIRARRGDGRPFLRCRVCEQARWRAKARVQVKSAWQRLPQSKRDVMRNAVFERDGRVCALRLPGCTVTATTVDHIRPVVKGGALLDPANGRPACGHCNSTRGKGDRPKRKVAVPAPREEQPPEVVQAVAVRLDRAQPLGLPPSREW